MLRRCALAVAGVAVAWAPGAWGTGAAGAESSPTGSAAPPSASQAEPVGLFDGMAQGTIEAQLIPRNARRCRVRVTNKTDRPLSVQLPEAFVGVPVLAQFAPIGPNEGLNPGANPPQNPMLPQQIGGPFNNPGGNNPLQNQGPGGPWGGPLHGPLMNLPPKRTVELKLATVCLEHGKPNPKPTIRYELRPVDKAVSDPVLQELLCLMGRKPVPYLVAQAAAWHLGSGKTWEDLRQMPTSQLAPGMPVFSPKDLRAAKALVEEAKGLAESQKKADRSNNTAAERS